jgi:hypothetical protein
MKKPGTSESHLIFIGDSITDCGRRTLPNRLGNGFVALIALHWIPHAYRRIMTNNCCQASSKTPTSLERLRYSSEGDIVAYGW